MRKNVASQVIGAQMVSATDGSAFTGSVTAYVTGDGGTQAVGSVGSGACTHEGNGFHTYAPAQAETNYDHVAFTFIGTGAVPATVQVYTSFPQTGDSFARLGAPAGASVSADVAAVKAETASILTDTAVIGAAGAGLTAVPWNASWDAEVQSECADALAAYDPPTKAELDAAVAPLALEATAQDILTDTGTTLPSTLSTIAGYLDTEIAAILADTNELQTDLANGGRLDLLIDAIKAKTDTLPASPAAVGSAMTLAADSMNAAALAADAVSEIQSGLSTLDAAGVRTAVGLATANLDTQLDAIPTANENADAFLKRDWTAVTGEAARSVLNALRFLRNKWSVAGSTLTVTKEDDSTAAWTGAVTTDAAADPITGNDPT